MPEPVDAPAGDVPVHRRTIEFESFDRGDAFEVVGRLQDRRPWAAGTRAIELLHHMELRVTVRKETLVITQADARMHAFPHAECPAVTAAFEGLVGLRVARGFVRQVQERFSGVSGCTHLEQLARSIGPVVVQTVTSRKAQAVLAGEAESVFSADSTGWALDTCHVWAAGGVAEQKLAAGWVPGKGPFPTPALVEFRDRSDRS